MEVSGRIELPTRILEGFRSYPLSYETVIWSCRPVLPWLIAGLQAAAFDDSPLQRSPSQNRTEVIRVRAGCFATKLKGIKLVKVGRVERPTPHSKCGSIPFTYTLLNWRPWAESNCRPVDPDSTALSTELQRHILEHTR